MYQYFNIYDFLSIGIFNGPCLLVWARWCHSGIILLLFQCLPPSLGPLLFYDFYFKYRRYYICLRFGMGMLVRLQGVACLKVLPSGWRVRFGVLLEGALKVLLFPGFFDRAKEDRTITFSWAFLENTPSEFVRRINESY